jgi:hypothetical protein
MAFRNFVYRVSAYIATMAVCESQDAFAQRLTEKQPAREGIYSLVEINPADLLWGRYRLAQENLLMESLSFAWNVEVQESRQKGKFEEQSLGTGMSLQYYPQSVTMQGAFIRAETNLALMGVSEGSVAKSHLAMMQVAGDLGWRVRISEKLTGSAAYGLRNTLPQILWGKTDNLSRRWIQEGEMSEVRVQINLGLLL